ncbi:hypothetical protein [Candidatus Methanoperedens nitratireducens]|uniref:Uncharacterized protein n=1 Tax=Candidatus Methanoperedens nitratireducens TaxID=1392998 RepID=A0A284VQ60_9EURY|nr:hypothetical protein [Candidatus Methanoperedens nitroreducens]SNQ61307.1 hypothetical protein MNV_30040 [Candidatus Methanoperedens nitroreducens]
MLETPEERIKLLRAGFTGETIERLYIEINNFKIVHTPPLVGLVELDSLQNKKTCINCEIAVECEQSFYEEGTPLC